MATSRTKPPRRRAARKSAPGTSVQNKVRRKKRTSAQTKKARWVWLTKQSRPKDVLPGWGELAADGGHTPSPPQASAFLEKVSTVRFALLLMAIAALFTLYVGHVHATQELAAEVAEARRANLRLHLKYNRLRGEFDRATGPAVVYQRARALGLEEGIEYGPTVKTGQ